LPPKTGLDEVIRLLREIGLGEVKAFALIWHVNWIQRIRLPEEGLGITAHTRILTVIFQSSWVGTMKYVINIIKWRLNNIILLKVSEDEVLWICLDP
jgi:hypothetical protein